MNHSLRSQNFSYSDAAALGMCAVSAFGSGMSTESLSYKHLFKKLYFLMILSVDQEALELYPKYDSVHHVHAVSAEAR